VDQVAERPEGLVDVGLGARPVDLVQVDVIGLQPEQAGFAFGYDPSAGVALVVGALAHLAVELCRQHDVLACGGTGLGQEIADDFFGLAGRVDVGGVDEIDPLVQGPLDDPVAIFVVGVPPGAEHHGAQA